jgi:hypothetical protein
MKIEENEFIEKMKGNIYIFFHLESEQQTYKICLEAVKIDISAVIHISPRFITPEIVSIVLIKDGTFQYLPLHILTDNFIIETLKINPYIFMNIPKQFQTYKICHHAVKINEELLSFVRDDLLDYNLCLLAVVNNGLMIKYCTRHIDNALCQLAIENNGKSLEFIPDKFRTNDIIFSSIKSSHHALQYIKDNEINETIIIYALEFYPTSKLLVKIINENILLKIAKNKKIIIEI